MSQLQKLDSYAAGLAIFSMFFGAGNIIFPLALGHYALDKTPYAILGLLVTAVIMPFIGLFTMFLYQGNIRQFFGRVGQKAGLMLAFLVISLLGPFGSTPRCIALAYSTLKLSFPYFSLSAISFSAIACLFLFFFSYKKNRLLSLLGYSLTPMLMGLLGLLVIKGFWGAPHVATSLSVQSDWQIFFHGLRDGYHTMDLLAAFFFAPLVLFSVRTKEEGMNMHVLKFTMKASGIGALLLSLVYISFSYLAAYYASQVGEIPSDQLLAALAMQILGPYAGFVIGLIVVLACLTTAIALIAAFTEFVYKEIFAERFNYKGIMLMNLVLTFCVSTLEFQGISQFLGPILQLCYPILILLTFYNLGHRLYHLRLASKGVAYDYL